MLTLSALLLAASTAYPHAFGSDLPSIEEVLRAFEASRSSASASQRSRWKRRSRLRALLPTVRGRFGTDIDLDIRDATTRTISEAHGLEGDVFLSWDLRGLVFDRAELAAHREAAKADARERRQVAEVIRLYVERMRLQARRGADPLTGDEALRALEIDAVLHSWTGGFWPLSP